MQANFFVVGLLLCAPALGVVRALAADDPSNASAPDKSSYNLFNPTPRALLREMSTDRPDKTESPYTVDAGHFQLEMDLVNYSRDRHNPARAHETVDSFAVAPMNLKAGLWNNFDLQVILQSYNSVRIHDDLTGAVEKHRGFGDVLVRGKLNLWGNDGGVTALGVVPYVKIPTNQDDLGNDSVEGGLIVPLAVELPMGWSMGLMEQVDIVRDGASGGYHPEFIQSVTFSHDLVGKLGGYVEFFSLVSTESGAPWIGTLDLGLTYGLTEDIQLDLGINLGVTRSADDLNPFAGVSWRF